MIASNNVFYDIGGIGGEPHGEYPKCFQQGLSNSCIFCIFRGVGTQISIRIPKCFQRCLPKSSSNANVFMMLGTQISIRLYIQ